MLAIFSSTSEDRAALLATLRGRQRVAAFDDWTRFERASAHAECAVVCCDHLDGETIAQLNDLASNLPFVPVVLVTQRDFENARHLIHVPVQEVVWSDDIVSDLPQAVVNARTQTVRNRLSAEIERAGRIPPRLRQALCFAVRSATPMNSVAGLARSVGCDRRTLWTHWTEVVGPGGSPRLKDFLDWLVLLRAGLSKTPARSWNAVASTLGIPIRNLARLVQRLLGSSLSGLGEMDPEELMRRFVSCALVPLLGESARRVLD